MTSVVIQTRLSRQFQTSKNFTSTRSTRRLRRTKIKNVHKKNLRGKKSLICLFAFLCFCLVASFVLLVILVHLVRAKSFCKKNKEFKTTLITSFTLLLKLQACNTSMNFFNQNLVQLSQPFSIITIVFNHHDLFQLSQSFSISLQLVTQSL